jgi:hypothetical protein
MHMVNTDSCVNIGTANATGPASGLSYDRETLSERRVQWFLAADVVSGMVWHLHTGSPYEKPILEY